MGKSALKSNSVTASPAILDPRAVLPRSQVDDWDDPYIPDEHYPDNTVCTGCGAVITNQHWALNEQKRDLLVNSGTANEVVCPACRIITSRDPQGIVTLSGDYWPQHREDIVNLIRNEEARAMKDNPLSRVAQIREEGESLIIETTNEKLAQRIGRLIHSAHKGHVDYKWSGPNDLVRVYWERHLVRV